MAIRDHTLLASLSLSAWRGQRLDRKTTKEVLDARHADSDAGKFDKFLVPKKKLDPIFTEHNAARRTFHRLTLPWLEGQNILTSAMFFDFREAMVKHKHAVERAVKVFMEEYPDLVRDAPKRLNGLYDATDYPSVTDMHAKFGFRLVLSPVPDHQDFRVKLGEEAEQELRQEIEQAVTEQSQAAQVELWERLEEALRHFATTMADEERVFRNTTVTNLREVAQLAPRLSLVPDSKLTDISERIVRLLDGLDPEHLRTNKVVRRDAASSAAETLAAIDAKMAGVF
jgi:hypothetical protein